MLGEGGFSEVLRGVRRSDGEVVAVKRVARKFINPLEVRAHAVGLE